MRVLANVALACFLLLAAGAAKAEGTVQQVGQFINNGVTAEIDTYTDNAVVVAVIVFKSNGHSYTFAFDRNDWPALERLWSAAVDKHASDYVSIGSLAETGTSEKCVMLMAAGPAIRLTIASPIDGAMSFDVAPSFATEFDAKLRDAASVTTAS